MLLNHSPLINEDYRNDTRKTFVGDISFPDYDANILNAEHDIPSYSLYKLHNGDIFVERYVGDWLEKVFVAKSDAEIIKLIGYSNSAKEIYKKCGINANKIVASGCSKDVEYSKHIFHRKHEENIEFIGRKLIDCEKKTSYSYEELSVYITPNNKLICATSRFIGDSEEEEDAWVIEVLMDAFKCDRLFDFADKGALSEITYLAIEKMKSIGYVDFDYRIDGDACIGKNVAYTLYKDECGKFFLTHSLDDYIFPKGHDFNEDFFYGFFCTEQEVIEKIGACSDARDFYKECGIKY